MFSFVTPLSPTIKKYLDVKLSNLPDSAMKPKSHLAASTSSVSARPKRLDSVVLERPKSSLSCRTDDSKGVKKAELDARPQSALQNRSAPLHRHEAKRVPLLTAERIPTGQIVSSSTQSVRPTLVRVHGHVGDPLLKATAASTGPKRIPLPEAPPVSQPAARADDVTQATLCNANSSTSGTFVQKSLNSDSKVIDNKKAASRLHNPSISSGMKTSESRRLAQRSISHPTQSQLAKTRPAATKPAVSRKTSHKPTVPKNTERKVTSHQSNNTKVQAVPTAALPTSSTATPESSDVPVAAQAKETVATCLGQAEGEALTELGLECETPKKAQNLAKDLLVNETPISALLTSIEQGFLFTPSSPLSPPEMYVNRKMIIDNQPFPLRIPQKDIVRTGQAELPTTDLKGEEQRQVLGIVEINSS